jgi:SNF2 family DNA or RNA helicase
VVHKIVTNDLLDWLGQQDREIQSEWLFLEESEEFRGCWQMSGLWPEWYIDLEPLVGAYRLVTPIRLPEVLSFAEERGYEVAFVDDPMDIIDGYQRVQDPPPFSLNSELENTTQGFLPWQTVGYNKLIKEDFPAGYFVWATGAGKSVMIVSAILHHCDEFDLAMVTVKSHNKMDTQRKLMALGDIDSVIIDGTREKRHVIYEQIESELATGHQVVAITNYEKFREDQVFKSLFKRRRCLFFWDEIAAKLSNPETQLYRAVKNALYSSFYSKPRPSWMRHWALSATPIENHPGDIWSCFNLMWPGLLGTQRQFEEIYVAGRNFMSGKPQTWKNLDRLEAKLGFVTHRVSKDDPEVVAMFPEVIKMPTIVDWDVRHRRVYDKLTGKAKDLMDEFDDANILAMIQIMQMVCDAPSMIKTSAEHRERFYEALEFERGNPSMSGPVGSDLAIRLLSVVDVEAISDVGHTKLEMWHEIIDKHPDDKIVTHSTWAGYIFPVWEHWLQKWGVSYVIYTGTDKQKQAALDAFREDSDIRMFLSGDAGADSIDIVEARVGINYNQPWKWTVWQQRQGRRDRVNSGFDTLYTYDLIMPHSVDERKLAICERKRQYHAAIFDGQGLYNESISTNMSRDELMYLITGQDGVI